jgi:hypothetical protein
LGSSPEIYAQALIALADIGLVEYRSSWIDRFLLSGYPSTEKRVKSIMGAHFEECSFLLAAQNILNNMRKLVHK